MKHPILSSIPVLLFIVACGSSGTSSDGSADGGHSLGDDPTSPGPSLGGKDPSGPATPTGAGTGTATGCDGKLDGVPQDTTKVVRSSWQFHPGTTFTDFGGVPGYPCKGFDFAKLPSMDESAWTNAPSGTSIAFHEASTFCATPPNPQYSKGQFRYFRSVLWIPKEGLSADLTLVASDIDDSLKVFIFNSQHPEGVSPEWAGNPETPAGGTCQGNGSMTVDLAPNLLRGELNAVVLAHADLNCAISSLGSVDLFTGEKHVDIIACPGAKDVPPPK